MASGITYQYLSPGTVLVPQLQRCGAEPSRHCRRGHRTDAPHRPLGDDPPVPRLEGDPEEVLALGRGDHTLTRRQTEPSVGCGCRALPVEDDQRPPGLDPRRVLRDEVPLLLGLVDRGGRGDDRIPRLDEHGVPVVVVRLVVEREVLDPPVQPDAEAAREVLVARPRDGEVPPLRVEPPELVGAQRRRRTVVPEQVDRRGRPSVELVELLGPEPAVVVTGLGTVEGAVSTGVARGRRLGEGRGRPREEQRDHHGDCHNGVHQRLGSGDSLRKHGHGAPSRE